MTERGGKEGITAKLNMLGTVDVSLNEICEIVWIRLMETKTVSLDKIAIFLPFPSEPYSLFKHWFAINCFSWQNCYIFYHFSVNHAMICNIFVNLLFFFLVLTCERSVNCCKVTDGIFLFFSTTVTLILMMFHSLLKIGMIMQIMHYMMSHVFIYPISF